MNFSLNLQIEVEQ